MTSLKTFEKNFVSDIDHLSSIIKLDEIYAIEGFYDATNNVIEQITKKKLPSKDDRKSLRVINIIILINLLLLFNSHQQNLLVQWFDENEEKKSHRKIIQTYLPNYTTFQLKLIVKMPQPPVGLLGDLTHKDLNDIYNYYSKNNSNFVIFLGVLKDLKDRKQENASQESTNKELNTTLRIAKKNIGICRAKVRESLMNAVLQTKPNENIRAKWTRKIEELSVIENNFFKKHNQKEQSKNQILTEERAFSKRVKGRKGKSKKIHDGKYLPSINSSKLQGNQNTSFKGNLKKATI